MTTDILKTKSEILKTIQLQCWGKKQPITGNEKKNKIRLGLIHEDANSQDSVKSDEKLWRESDPNDAWYTGN